MLPISLSTSAAGALLGGQANALIVGEAQPARAELLAEHPILGLEIVDHVALLLVDPAGQGDEEKPQRVRSRNHRAQAIKEAPRRHSGGRATDSQRGWGDPVARSNFWTIRGAQDRRAGQRVASAVA